MARARAFPAALLLFLLLVAAGKRPLFAAGPGRHILVVAGEHLPVSTVYCGEMTGTTTMVEAGRICATPSSRFKFLCLSDHNCQSVCNSEGFPGGDCHGLRRRCYCTKPC